MEKLEHLLNLNPKFMMTCAVILLTKPKRKDLENEEVESSDDEEILPNEKERKARISDDDDEETYETAHEKRYRLAKEYLSAIEEQEREKVESSTIDQDAISHRLKEDMLSKAGKLHKRIASQLNAPVADEIKILKGHKLSPTCIATTSDDRKCVTGSKDGTIICSGSSDGLIRVWDFNSMILMKEFTGHKGSVTGLVFRQGHNQLFSCGQDRSVKIWNLDEMGYVDTMFGHQDSISSIDALSRERAITSGSRDRSIRVWKIVEESQLVFNAHSKCGSVECLSLINEDHFVSGADDGYVQITYRINTSTNQRDREKLHYESATDRDETGTRIRIR
uniref:U3 small nucleolar RNA-interacting protein 2 n=1 Tax=Romanomermis culicivorax TaxID=13658 RepID=A0A915JNP0_ROMCU